MLTLTDDRDPRLKEVLGAGLADHNAEMARIRDWRASETGAHWRWPFTIRRPANWRAASLDARRIFGLEGGRGTKSGEKLRAKGNYGLNPKGKPHSAFIGQETVTLVIYNGEPDDVRSLDVIDKAADGAGRD